MKRKSLPLRWLQFNLVGAVGFVFQLLLLAVFHHGLGWDYRVATGLAVELTVIHNYFWHERWTWRDRPLSGSWWAAVKRLLLFNFSNGGISLVGNLVLMQVLVGYLSLPVLFANLLAILTCSALNFVASHHLVFGVKCLSDSSPRG